LGIFFKGEGGGGGLSYEVGNTIHDQNMLLMDTIIYVTSNKAKKAVFCFLEGGKRSKTGLQNAIQACYVL
jgi:hypothetical protein